MRVPLRPTEISLNDPMVLNDTEWYSMIFNGIPLALFFLIKHNILLQKCVWSDEFVNEVDRKNPTN